MELENLDSSFVYYGSPRGGDLEFFLKPFTAVCGYAGFNLPALDSTTVLSGSTYTASVTAADLGTIKKLLIRFEVTMAAGEELVATVSTDDVIFGKTTINSNGEYFLFATVAEANTTFTLTLTRSIGSPYVVDDCIEIYESYFDQDHMVFSEYLKTSEIGWVPVPRGGDVIAVLPLHDVVMVYTTNEVATMTPLSNGMFDIRTVFDVGIGGRGCVTGDLSRHVFVDASGYIREYTREGGVKLLGYNQIAGTYLGTANNSNIIMSFEKNEGDAFIGCSAAAGSLLLSRTGLTRLGQVITGIIGPVYNSIHGAVTLGAVGTTAVSTVTGVDADETYLKSGVLDVGPGLKTIDCLKVLSDTSEAVYARLSYRHDKVLGHDLKQTDWKIVDQRGEAHFSITCLDFYFEILSANLKVDSIIAVYEESQTGVKANVRDFLRRVK
jgi:hypothetical protein